MYSIRQISRRKYFRSFFSRSMREQTLLAMSHDRLDDDEVVVVAARQLGGNIAAARRVDVFDAIHRADERADEPHDFAACNRRSPLEPCVTPIPLSDRRARAAPAKGTAPDSEHRRRPRSPPRSASLRWTPRCEPCADVRSDDSGEDRRLSRSPR